MIYKTDNMISIHHLPTHGAFPDATGIQIFILACRYREQAPEPTRKESSEEEKKKKKKKKKPNG
jgi:hypothetical protein